MAVVGIHLIGWCSAIGLPMSVEAAGVPSILK
jgi:hypothetical protein